jgi:hypothetical protein
MKNRKYYTVRTLKKSNRTLFEEAREENTGKRKKTKKQQNVSFLPINSVLK